MSTPLRPVEPESEKRPPVGEEGGAPRRWLPLAIIGVAAGLVALLFATRPAVEVKAPDYLPPTVRVVEVSPATLALNVHAEGSVDAAVRSDLLAEVSGRVTSVGPSLVEGGGFEEGEILLRLDDRDYRVALEKARAAVERGESETALAESRLKRWTRLEAGGAVSMDQLEDATNRARVAHAELRTARADLARAELDLERTVMRAPYDGRVLTREVDRGQFISRGTRIATVYAIDLAEVRLPVPDEALAHLGLPLDFHREPDRPGAPVILRATVAGQATAWEGQIDRVEGQVDPRTRMVTLVAQVEDPFGRVEPREGPPLAPGLFVRAEIRGRDAEGVVRLPAGALRAGDQVLVLDGDRLRFRAVTVLRRERDTILVGAGLAAGDVVCVSPLEAATEGMQVRRVPAS